MPSATLVAGGLMTLVEGVGYLVVAGLLAARPVASEMRLGSSLFQGWWVGIGVNKVLAALAGLGATFGLIDGAVYVSVLYFNLVLLAASFWCLLSYFSFLYTGRTTAFFALGLLCTAYLVFLTYNLAATRPLGYALGEWRTYHTFEVAAPVWRSLVLLGTLVALPLAPALAHLRLLSRLTDRARRYRVVLVTGGILLWTTSVFFVAFPGFDASPTRQVLSRLVGALGALLALWAYRPPTWVKKWLGDDVVVPVGA